MSGKEWSLTIQCSECGEEATIDIGGTPQPTTKEDYETLRKFKKCDSCYFVEAIHKQPELKKTFKDIAHKEGNKALFKIGNRIIYLET